MNETTIVEFIRDLYRTEQFIPLHAPEFRNNELRYVGETIKSTFVSSVGSYVNDFEKALEQYCSSEKAIATVNGTAALHSALYMAGVQHNDLVITQALTFVATCNALHHMGAEPLFIDVSRKSLGLCPNSVEMYLNENTELRDDGCFHLSTGQRIRAMVPMHTFGHPVELDELKSICGNWKIALVEDAAEGLGSFYKGKHSGTIGEFGAISFNGNKIITTGGGGAVLCKTASSGQRLKHITTTAKIPHPYEFIHDEPGFNYRLPNLNAALGCAQMEVLAERVKMKRELAEKYRAFFNNSEYEFVTEPEYAESNYWLNAVICQERVHRDEMLHRLNEEQVMARPVWRLMSKLPMFSNALRGPLPLSEWLEDRLVNIPSSPVYKA